MSSRAAFIATWSPRVGKRAARLAHSSSRATAIGIWSVPVWVLLYLAGTGWNRILAYLTAAAGFLLLGYGALSLHLMYRSLSRRFGVRVHWRDAPTFRWRRYSAWCRVHDIDPIRGRRLDRSAPARPARPSGE